MILKDSSQTAYINDHRKALNLIKGLGMAILTEKWIKKGATITGGKGKAK